MRLNVLGRRSARMWFWIMLSAVVFAHAPTAAQEGGGGPALDKTSAAHRLVAPSGATHQDVAMLSARRPQRIRVAGPSLPAFTDRSGARRPLHKGAAAASPDAQEVYQLDDGSQENAVGVATGANIHWVLSYTVLPGFTNLRTINVAWDMSTPPASAARIGVYSDPNNDGVPWDVALVNVLRDEAVVTSHEGSGVPVKYNIADVLAGPAGGTFFLFGFRAAGAGEFPASIDEGPSGCTGASGPPCPASGRNWIRVGTSSPPMANLILLESVNGLFGNLMLRADAGPPIICKDGMCDPAETCTCFEDCGPPPVGTLETDHGPNTCDDGLDNDCDMSVDCDEPECLKFAGEMPGPACSDGEDNDCDGLFDCGDDGCQPDPACATCELVRCAAEAEGEPVCFDGYEDAFNAGCNANPDGPWSFITMPPPGNPCSKLPLPMVQRCGSSGRHTSLCDLDDDCPAGTTCDTGSGQCSDGSFPSVRDTDWYQFVLPECREVTLCVTAEFGALIGFVDDEGGPNCPSAAFAASATGSGDVDCSEICVTTQLPEGTWTAFVAPSAATANAGVRCGAKYLMSLFSILCQPIIEACNDVGPNECQFPEQQGHGDDDTVAVMSDTNPHANARSADNFVATPGTITEVCWWGAYLSPEGDPCGGNSCDDYFTVTYYNNDAGGSHPGSIKAGPYELGDSKGVPTGLVIPTASGPVEEFGYTAGHPPVSVLDGECLWMEIQNNTPPGRECVWHWETTAGLDGLSAQHSGAGPYAGGDDRDFDLAFCVDQSLHTEACCLQSAPVGITCVNDQHDEECWDGPDPDQVRDDPCLWYRCTSPGVCDPPVPIIFGDMAGSFTACPPNGFVNLFDRTQALTCFAGTSPCSKFQADTGGAFGSCVPDGFCNLFDVNHVLQVFAGRSACACPCTPLNAVAPSGQPATAAPDAAELDPAEAVHLTLAASRKQVRPGEEIQVRIMTAQALRDLQSYQFHLGAGGGRSGRLDLVDISLEAPPSIPAVFPSGDPRFEAFNLATGQALHGLDAGGVAVPAGALLATYTYRASPDAAGAFVVDALHDEAEGHQTFMVSDFTRKIEITGTSPAIIEVRRAELPRDY